MWVLLLIHFSENIPEISKHILIFVLGKILENESNTYEKCLSGLPTRLIQREFAFLVKVFILFIAYFKCHGFVNSLKSVINKINSKKY